MKSRLPLAFAVAAIVLAAGAAAESGPLAVMRIEPEPSDAVSALQAVGVRTSPQGSAELQCATHPDGALDGCRVLREEPRDMRLGKAAVALAANYRADAAGPIRVSVTFKAFRTVGWTHLPDRAELKHALRAARLGDDVEGFAALVCTAGLDGRLKDCRVAVSRPNTHYGQAAMALAPVITFEPATYDGRPTAGRITVPVTFSAS